MRHGGSHRFGRVIHVARDDIDERGGAAFVRDVDNLQAGRAVEHLRDEVRGRVREPAPSLEPLVVRLGEEVEAEEEECAKDV